MNKFSPFTFVIAKLIFKANPNNKQTAVFYKTITQTNIYQWFIYSGYERDSTRICTDYQMSQNCTIRGFDHDYANDGISVSDGTSTIMWGTGLEKFGYEKTSYQPFHANIDGQNGWCSTTGNLNNNQWTDVAIDGHWGNGLEILMK